jgi:hypothetical protein
MAKHALDEFQAQYEFLLARGKDSEASDLLRGTESLPKRFLSFRRLRGASRSVWTRTTTPA